LSGVVEKDAVADDFRSEAVTATAHVSLFSTLLSQTSALPQSVGNEMTEQMRSLSRKMLLSITNWFALTGRHPKGSHRKCRNTEEKLQVLLPSVPKLVT